MKVLVTGGLGFIGAHTCEALLEQGIMVVATYHHNDKVPAFLQKYLGQQLTVEQVDVTDSDKLHTIASTHEITHIVHLAAPKIGALQIIEDLQANIQGLMNILQIGRSRGTARIVIASSIGVYGGAPNPLSEDAPLSLSGANPIGANKKIFEIIGDAVAIHADMDIALVRPSAVWGPLGRPRSVFFALPQMVYAAARGAGFEDLGPLYSDDGIDMCYVTDCARAICSLATADRLTHRTYNIGSGHATTNAEIATILKEIAPSAHFDLKKGHAPHAPANNWYMDIGRLQQDGGFRPSQDLKQNIHEYFNWIQAND